MKIERVGFELDPNDPRFPTRDQWERMSGDERRRVVDALPDEKQLNPSEGDHHYEATHVAVDTLKRFFGGGGSGRALYIASNMTTCYPSERPFAPDVLAVANVPVHPRTFWNVVDEGKGLDLVIEMHWAGDWKKDSLTNVTRYARLGIHEYFLFDVKRGHLAGWRLPNADARQYVPLIGQGGVFESEVLGLRLRAENGLVRFLNGPNPLLNASELAAHLEHIVAEAQQRAMAEAERAEEAERRAEAEKTRAEETAARLAAALAELEKLRGR